MRRNMPRKENFIGKTIPTYPNHVIKEHVASGANGHLFRAYSTLENSTLAFKIVPIGNLVTDQKEQYLGEARRANTLEHESAVGHIQVVDYTDGDSGTPCVVFVCEYINGPSLDKYLKDSKNHSTVDLAFIRSFLETMLGLLFELQERGYEHGDLHAGNILVVKSRFDINDRVVFRVTDFGVRNFVDASQHADDFLNIANILRRLLEFIDFREASGRDRFIFNSLRDRFLKRYFLETDPTVDEFARNPREILRQLKALDTEYRQAQIAELDEGGLVTPFDYPNCEQIGDSHLMLRALYSNRLLELTKIEAHTNVVLTGPRGCGKTTVFKALSLEYRTSTGQDAPDHVPYVGIYYRCDDLYFAFPRYRELPRDDATDIPVHFLIVTLLSLLLRHLEYWAKRHYAEEWDAKVGTVVEELWEIFEWTKPHGPNARDPSTLVRKLAKERRNAEGTYRFATRPEQPVRGFCGPGRMVEVCRMLRKSFSFLNSRVFHFYIDDYSWPKISKDLQANLNRLLMHRGPDAFFKISTESPVSFVRHDLDGKNFAEAREYDFINLGVRYITDKTGQTAAFIGDLFARRFQAVQDYPVRNLKELLGSCPRNDNARARVARRKAGEREKEKYRYLYGEEIISLMCSGDIHHMIRLVSRMVDDFGGPERLRESGSSIPPENQQQSIRNEAGAVMESIRTVPKVGPKLANVVSAFGNVAHSYLLHKNSKNELGNPPRQASKIEPYEALHLSRDAEHIREDLLRYSVFIEDPKGKSRRGDVVPRFFLRRSLIPHFQLTFSQRDSVLLGNQDIELLLLEPKRFEDKFRIRSSDDGGPVRNRYIKDMFDE